MMSDAVAQPSVIKMTVQVKRKSTGLVETYVLTGKPEFVEPVGKQGDSKWQ